MKINIENGNFTVGKYLFSSNMKIKDLQDYLTSQEIELWTSNEN